MAWNAAATAVLGDFAALGPRERNALRRMFGDPAMRSHLPDWENNARLVLSVFRVEIARGGPSSEAAALVPHSHASSLMCSIPSSRLRSTSSAITKS